MAFSIQRLAKGEERGLILRLAKAHVARCPQCQAALKALESYFMLVEPQDQARSILRWNKFAAKLDDIDKP
jgi:hypothetical protein